MMVSQEDDQGDRIVPGYGTGDYIIIKKDGRQFYQDQVHMNADIMLKGYRYIPSP